MLPSCLTQQKSPMNFVFWKLPCNKLLNMHQNISVLKQNSAIKQIEISRVTNGTGAFLFSWHQTRSMETVFFQHVSLQIHPGTCLAHVVALPVLQCSLWTPAASAQPSSPHLYLAQISLLKNKPRKTDSNLCSPSERHGKGNGQKWLIREVSTQRECQIKVKFINSL